MTGTHISTDVAVFVPAGRPVVRFVAALAGIALVFAGLWATGLIAARVHVTVHHGPVDAQTNGGSVSIELRNAAFLSARVDRVDLVADNIRRTTAFRPRLIDGRGRVELRVPFVVDCGAAVRARLRHAPLSALTIRVHVQGAAGLGRWVNGGYPSSVTYCVPGSSAPPRRVP
jgi:hypothetical protein